MHSAKIYYEAIKKLSNVSLPCFEKLKFLELFLFLYHWSVPVAVAVALVDNVELMKGAL